MNYTSKYFNALSGLRFIEADVEHIKMEYKI